MEDKSIYIGNQIPCLFHVLKKFLNKENFQKIFLTFDNRNFEHLNLMFWSKMELSSPLID